MEPGEGGEAPKTEDKGRVGRFLDKLRGRDQAPEQQPEVKSEVIDSVMQGQQESGEDEASTKVTTPELVGTMHGRFEDPNKHPIYQKPGEPNLATPQHSEPGMVETTPRPQTFGRIETTTSGGVVSRRVAQRPAGGPPMAGKSGSKTFAPGKSSL